MTHRFYTPPTCGTIRTVQATLLSASGNILHDANTQKDHSGPEFGGDEPSDGGDLEGAKKHIRWEDEPCRR